MVTPRVFTFSLAAASVATANQFLQVVWSTGHFSTIAPPSGGNMYGHDSGFAITDAQGNELWSAAFPGDHDPCYNTGGGRTFTLDSTCWRRPRQFRCEATAGGNPKNCEVYDIAGNSIVSAEGNTETHFIGIALAQDGSCGFTFILEAGELCDDKATWTVS